MAFILDQAYSPTAKLLAQKLWDFSVYVVGARPNTYNPNSILMDWAREFDSFVRDKPSQEVIQVMDFYIARWQREQGFIHRTPATFISDYPILLEQCKRHYRPLPLTEIQSVLDRLRYERWFCDWEDVITSVSQGVFNLREYHRIVQAFPYHITTMRPVDRQTLHAVFGNPIEYVQTHFLRNCQRKPKSVWMWQIDHDYIKKELRTFLSEQGYPQKRIMQYITMFEQVYKGGK